MKVAQNDETNPDTQSVRPPHLPNLSNSQLSPSGPSVRKRETSGILSRMFPPFTGITSYYVRSPLAPHIAMLRLVMLRFLCYLLCSPLRYFFPVDSETGADVRVFDYTEDDPPCQSNQASPPLIIRYRLPFSLLLASE